MALDHAGAHWNAKSCFDFRNADVQNSAIETGINLLVDDFGVEFELAEQVNCRQFFLQNDGSFFEEGWCALCCNGQYVLFNLQLNIIENYAWKSDFNDELLVELEDVGWSGHACEVVV